eukprot:5492530-Alexandrium_andersonii.AAC.1
MAESLRRRGQAPLQRLAGAPSEPPPNGRSITGEDAFTQQLGAPRSECSRPQYGARLGAALRGPQ